MKVFISWSGKLSKQIGEAIKDWLPAVLQNVKPYFTPDDVEKGSRWNADISENLEESRLGIFIYTKENLDSPWMLFEAGAISKTLDNSKVCPILFGLDNSDFKGPLTQFQTSQFNKLDFKKLVNSINKSQSDQKLEDKVFDDVFEMWWPKLEDKILNILNRNKVENKALREDRELIEEILELTRLTAKRNHVINLDGGNIIMKNNLENKVLSMMIKEFLTHTEILFAEDWDHTKTLIKDDNLDNYISPYGNFLNPNISDEGNNWANRLSYLEAYRNLKKLIEKPYRSGFPNTISY